jgi:hypothetical protein
MFLAWVKLVSGEVAAFLTLLLYAIAALNPEINRKPVAAIDAKNENKKVISQ